MLTSLSIRWVLTACLKDYNEFNLFIFKGSLFHDLMPLNLKALDPFLSVDGRETDNVLCLVSTSCTWLTIPELSVR